MLHILIFVILYLFPAAILFHFASDTFSRNPGRSEFRLASLALFTVVLKFVEEFVRQMLPISYSAPLVLYGLGNLGALSAAFVMHFYFKITRSTTGIRPRLYLPVSYAILVPSVLTSLLNHHIDKFYQTAIWIQPVFNTLYFIRISIGIVVLIALSALMYVASNKALVSASKKNFRILFYATGFIAVWHVLFGILPGAFPWFRHLPPYPYIFGDLFWMSMLRWAMSKHELLPPYGKQYKTLFNLVPAAIIVSDLRGRILEANPTAQQLFGTGRGQLTQLLSGSAAQHEALVELFKTRSTIHNFESELLQHDGTRISVLLSVDFVEVNGKPLSISVIRDITDRKIADQQIEHLAYYDSLTDLPNRAHFYQLLEAAITASYQVPDVSSATPEIKRFAVVLIDIDHFKLINDSYGHQAGDTVICHVADTLRSFLQPDDIAARLGGDEFVMLLHRSVSQDNLLQAASDLVQALHQDVTWDSQSITLSASVGLAMYPDNGANPDELVKAADIAMYDAKETGKNQFAVFGQRLLELEPPLNEAP